MSFPCTFCGLCCKNVDILIRSQEMFPPGKENKFIFPYKHKEGVCEKLGDDNKCTTYETRPLICRIDDTAKELKINKERFYELNIKSCHAFMKSAGIYEKFKIG